MSKSKSMALVSREEWGALPARDEKPLTHPVGHVITWFTFSPPADEKSGEKQLVQQLQREHMEDGHSDIIYNFLIGGDGTVYEGRGWHSCSAGSLKYNPEAAGNRIDIAFIGQFTDTPIPQEMSNANISLIDEGVKKHYIKRFLTYIQLTEGGK